MLRGSRGYFSRVIGSSTSAMIDRVAFSVNGSITAVSASGTSSMSDSSIVWKPRTEEPSNGRPTVKTSSSNR